MAKEKNVRKILITGATGNQGGAVLRHLTGNPSFALRALTRNPESETARAISKLGVEVVKGNLKDEESLVSALDGVRGVFSVQTMFDEGVAGEEEQGKRLARIARDKGVQHFVYTSVASADRKTNIPHFDSKYHIEETVRSLKFPSYAIMRPVFFMENLKAPWVRQGDKLALGIKPERNLQMIAVEDIGKFGALLFEKSSELSGREIDIAGDEITMPMAARLFTEALDRKIDYERTPIEEIRKSNEDFALMYEWFDKVGYNVDISRLERVYGIKLQRLGEWVRKNIRPTA